MKLRDNSDNVTAKQVDFTAYKNLIILENYKQNGVKDYSCSIIPEWPMRFYKHLQSEISMNAV